MTRAGRLNLWCWNRRHWQGQTTCSDSVDKDGTVLIMKEISLEDDYVSYEIVEDEEELEIISKIFNELIEDFDLTV